jgi:voltage-gated potassium channel
VQRSWLIETLRQTVEEQDTWEGRAFDIFIQILIVLSLISFSFQTLPNLSESWERRLWLFEIFTVGIFTIEFALRWLVSTDKKKYWKSGWTYIDLLAIAPFYISLALSSYGIRMDGRWLRVFRLLRVFRTFKLLRFGSAVDRLTTAFHLIWKELVLFLSVALILIYVAGVLIYYVENLAGSKDFQSVFDGLWWAVVTLTTVGYGDIVPVTPLGRLLTFFILLIGLGIIAVPSGLLAAALSQAHRGNQKEQVNKN